MQEFSLTPDPSAEEAAAMIAAVQRFLSDTSSPGAPESAPESGWLRAALVEGVGDVDKHAIW